MYTTPNDNSYSPAPPMSPVKILAYLDMVGKSLCIAANGHPLPTPVVYSIAMLLRAVRDRIAEDNNIGPESVDGSPAFFAECVAEEDFGSPDDYPNCAGN